ncbi:MAG: phosphatase PAP2 family protein [Acidimicrobiia bacterium]|nr:phosphatase PAP2 family protein [Acidimicrobiia bacterium]
MGMLSSSPAATADGARLLPFRLLARYQRPLGWIGIAVWISWFVLHPSSPSPDKLFPLVVAGSMAAGALRDGLTRFTPFVALFMVYESFRGLADDLDRRVEMHLLANLDRTLFGGELPTIRLQNWLYDGTPGPFDVAMTIVYLMHFVVPFGLAFLIWRRAVQHYWPYVMSILLTCYAGFVTFVLFPAAPPWLALEEGELSGFSRVGMEVFERLPFHDVPTLYRGVSPNLVAPMPSLHASFATLVAVFTFKAFGRRWGTFSLIYPALIYFSTVYLGEHYLIDEIAGGLYAYGGYVASKILVDGIRRRSAARAERARSGEPPVPERVPEPVG